MRLSKWYNTYSQKDRAKVTKEISPLVLQRAPKVCVRHGKYALELCACICSASLWTPAKNGADSVCMQMCNFLDWRDLKIVYKRYASLYFVCAVDPTDNELISLDMIHLFVEVLDKHFGNVCELDLVFNFYKAYWLLDEVFLAGAMSPLGVQCERLSWPPSVLLLLEDLHSCFCTN